MVGKDIVKKGKSILEKLGINIGFKTTHTKTITEEDVRLFAGVSGDYNPIHMNDEFAKKTFFHGRIAHGAFAEALLSAAMAKLPGLVIFISQSVNFVRPVKIGDTIAAVAEVIKMQKNKGILILKNVCVNQNGEVVVEGKSVVRIFPLPF